MYYNMDMLNTNFFVKYASNIFFSVIICYILNTSKKELELRKTIFIGGIFMRKKFLLAVMAAATMFVMAIPAYADKTMLAYSYSYATGGAAYTEGRAKDKQSATHMTCSSCVDINTGRATGGGYAGVVYGSTAINGSYINPVTKDGTGSSTYYFSAGSDHCMSNYVYQVYRTEQKNAKSWAKVRGTMTGSTGYIKLSGRWAPDI